MNLSNATYEWSRVGKDGAKVKENVEGYALNGCGKYKIMGIVNDPSLPNLSELATAETSGCESSPMRKEGEARRLKTLRDNVVDGTCGFHERPWGDSHIPHTPPQLVTETTAASTGDAGYPHMKQERSSSTVSDAGAGMEGSATSVSVSSSSFLCYPDCSHLWLEGFPTPPSYISTEDEPHWALIQRLRSGQHYLFGANTVTTASGAHHTLQVAGSAAVSIFDMVELIVTCPSFSSYCLDEMSRRTKQEQDPDFYQHSVAFQQLFDSHLRFNRRIGVHAGITLYNLHRVLCFTFQYDEKTSEIPLHMWHVPNANACYANGQVFREEARKSKMLMTDKTIALSDLLPVDNWSGFQFHYVLGGVQFNIIISDLLKGQTAQQDLLWVPRLCEGSFGFPPPAVLINDSDFIRNLSSYNFVNRFSASSSGLKLDGSNSNDYDAVDTEEENSGAESSAEDGEQSSAPLTCVTTTVFDRIVENLLNQDQTFDIDAINRVLSETRFGRNLAVSRKSKRTRITAFKEETARLVQFRLPIRTFFGEPSTKYTDCILDRPKKKRRQKLSSRTDSSYIEKGIAD